MSKTETPSSSASSGVKPQRKQKAFLCEQDVLQIYSNRPLRDEDGTFLPSTSRSKELADMYKVSDKTVRDIWNRRSWGKVTRPLWSEAEVAAVQSQERSLLSSSSQDKSIVLARTRAPGRPRGSHDTVKRRKEPEEHDQEPSVQEEEEEVESEQDDAEEEVRKTEEDPFSIDWQAAKVAFDLSTMVSAMDMATPAGVLLALPLPSSALFLPRFSAAGADATAAVEAGGWSMADEQAEDVAVWKAKMLCEYAAEYAANYA